jgi:hypothetical protein
MKKQKPVEIVLGHSSRDYEYLRVAFGSMLALAVLNGDTRREQQYRKNIAILEGSQR